MRSSLPGSCLTPRKTPPSRLQRSERNSAKNSPASEPVKSGARENRKSRTAEFLKTASTDVRILSCADAFAKAVESCIHTEEAVQLAIDFNGKSFGHLGACPECGGALSHESGCVTCHDCGYSQCD